ncbi:unnamed protein product [Allacma fusca]|uniref:Uncharacterized protein n=1 Tax=Allacma fusca TaxID=39272 RepID=A0A8J2K8K2_9HEXA|nr:unnamed protein product [Allacma fusca]
MKDTLFLLETILCTNALTEYFPKLCDYMEDCIFFGTEDVSDNKEVRSGDAIYIHLEFAWPQIEQGQLVLTSS